MSNAPERQYHPPSDTRFRLLTAGSTERYLRNTALIALARQQIAFDKEQATLRKKFQATGHLS